MKKITGNTTRYLLGITILLVVIGFSDSCTKKTASDMYGTTVGTKGTDGPGANQVWIQDMAYNPSTITVTAGTTITWYNKDPMAHTVTSTTGLFDSGSINSNGTYSHLFSTAGTYPYYCTIHPSMNGTVVVK